MQNTVENYPIENIPFLYKYGLKIQNSTISPETKLSILAGTCRDSLDIIDIRLGELNPNLIGNTTSAPVRIDSTLHGAGGLAEGEIAANTMYAIYIIADSRNYLPISAIATEGTNIYLINGPLMPAGYDSHRLIGFWATDSNKYWMIGYYFGLGNEISFTYDTPQETAVSAGSSSTYAYVNLFNLVPDIHNIPVLIFTIFSPGAARDTLTMASGRSNALNGQVVITGQVEDVDITTISSMLVQLVHITDFPSPAIQYKVSGADSVAIYVAGFSVSL